MNNAISSTQRTGEKDFYFDPGIAAGNERVFHQNFYRELVFMQHELAGGLTKDGSLVCMNENLKQFLSIPFAGTQMDTFFSYVLPEDLPRVREYFSSVSAQNQEISFDCRMISDQDTIRRVAWRIKLCPDIPPIRFLILGYLLPDQCANDGALEYYRNILDGMVYTWKQQLRHIQKKIEQEIVRRRKIEHTLTTLIMDVENEVIILKEIVKNTPDFLFVFDREGNLQYINQQGADLLGSPVHTLIGKNMTELGLAPEVLNLIPDTLRAERGSPASSQGVLQTGNHVYEYGLTPLSDDFGSITATLLLLRSKQADTT